MFDRDQIIRAVSIVSNTPEHMIRDGRCPREQKMAMWLLRHVSGLTCAEIGKSMRCGTRVAHDACEEIDRLTCEGSGIVIDLEAMEAVVSAPRWREFA